MRLPVAGISATVCIASFSKRGEVGGERETFSGLALSPFLIRRVYKLLCKITSTLYKIVAGIVSMVYPYRGGGVNAETATWTTDSSVVGATRHESSRTRTGTRGKHQCH